MNCNQVKVIVRNRVKVKILTWRKLNHVLHCPVMIRRVTRNQVGEGPSWVKVKVRS